MGACVYINHNYTFKLALSDTTHVNVFARLQTLFLQGNRNIRSSDLEMYLDCLKQMKVIYLLKSDILRIGR